MEIIATIMTSETHGIGMFKYYTIESNIFAGISSAIFVVVAILHLTKGHSIPKWVKGLRYMATCCLTVTIAVVLFAAMPMEPRENAFEIWMTYREAIFQHLICPIVSFISFVFFEKEPKMRRKFILVGFSPTVAYGVGVVGLTLNQDIEALYTFAAVSTQPVMVSIFWVLQSWEPLF